MGEAKGVKEKRGGGGVKSACIAAVFQSRGEANSTSWDKGSFYLYKR